METRKNLRQKNPFLFNGCSLIPFLDGEEQSGDSTHFLCWTELWKPMDATPLTLRSAPSVVEVIELAPTLPKELDPTLYEDLIVAMRVVEVAPDGTTSEPKVRWCLAASTGVHVKPNRRHERGYVIDLANRIIVQRLVGNKDLSFPLLLAFATERTRRAPQSTRAVLSLAARAAPL